MKGIIMTEYVISTHETVKQAWDTCITLRKIMREHTRFSYVVVQCASVTIDGKWHNYQVVQRG